MSKPKTSRVSRYAFLVLAGLLGLGGCSGPALSPGVRALPESVELSGVPFFPQRAYQSAPAALASLLTAQGEVITPGLLEKPLRLPQDEQGLAERIAEVANRHGLLVYPLEPTLEALLVQVADGHPVLARVNEGWLESPRFVLLIGYERVKRNVVLRAGAERRRLMSFADFQSAWRAGGQWAVLVQSPRQLPANIDRSRWRQAADALERAGQGTAAANARRRLGNE